ncbi:hypothetical protein B0T26DRAFT_740999 [Lasiosphaeria miniovina]|uniref:Uncharacterized protein n=1 Tax=Lasiosphaeria miniovina TaxID=1954250 RepID=A0AA40AL95_9PEZI|nr:uncharacterized protein B0T26DRAFT_740999 [Lasiosphaeria miniovina]KAK0717807.1 hypothetical protein B0T26DRAFT_740999 [Lasiosphaeria miniovina]
MSQPTPLQQAQSECLKIIDGGPYTGMFMLKHILHTAGISYSQFLVDPKHSIRGATNAYMNMATIEQLAPTWSVDSGRCTSFAVKAINNLNAHKDAKGNPIFKFEIYDLYRHRVARCRNTGIVLDSSSSIPGGAFILPEGNWGVFPETNASWKFKNSESMFERQGKVNGQVKKSSTPISSAQAMFTCLCEVEASAYKTIPTLFRSVDRNHVAVFHGMIMWSPRDHALEMGATITDLRAGRRLVIQFPKYIKNKSGETVPDPKMMGTEENLHSCLEHLLIFVREHGGPYGEHQWTNTGLEAFNTELIQAAVDTWGYPKLVAYVVN